MKQGDKIAHQVRRQGLRVRATKSGYFAYAPAPDRRTVGWHRTPSDHRAVKNLIAELRRIGAEVTA